MKYLFKSILLALAMMVAIQLQAQSDLSNNGILGINPGTTFFITGSFSNSAGGTFVNRGNLHVLQGVANAQPGMSSGDGTLYLSGTGMQILTGSQPFKTFNLVSNNPSGFLLNNDLSVLGTHTYSAGIIRTAIIPTPHYLIYENGSSYSGDGDSKHVNGWVRRVGATPFKFPVGNGLVERSLSMKELSSSSTFDVQYALNTPTTNGTTPPLATVHLNEYWTVNKVSGGSAKIDLNWDNSKVAMSHFSLSELRFVTLEGGVWVDKGSGATGDIATTGSITSNTLSTFGMMTFGSIGYISPSLIVRFTAKAANGGNLVNWTTINGTNLHHFDLQRSDDGIGFYNISVLPAQTGTLAPSYQFLDSKPVQQPLVYYRLISVENGGPSKMSKIIVLTANGNTDGSIFPANPVHGNIDMLVLNISGTFNFKLLTPLGQVIQQGVLNVTVPGKYTIQRKQGLSRGIYILQLEQPGFKYQQRLLID